MDPIKLGIALDNVLNERWNKEIVTIKKNMAKHSGTTLTKTAFGKHETQLANVIELVEQENINTLLLVPVDGDKAEEITTYCDKHNVKIVLYSRPITKGKVDFVIKFDVQKIGHDQAEYVIKHKKGPNTLIIHGPKSDLNSIALLEGQMESFSPLESTKEINLLGTYYLDNWTKTKAEQTVKIAFENHPVVIHNIVAANDMIAEAAAKHIAKHNLPPAIITGLDAELNACKRILDGTQSMSVALLPTTIAQCASDVISFLNGVNPDIRSQHNVTTGFFGTRSHKVIDTNCVVITKHNLKEIVTKEKLFPANWL